MRTLAVIGGGLLFVSLAACGGASQTNTGVQGTGGFGTGAQGNNTGGDTSGNGGSADSGGTSSGSGGAANSGGTTASGGSSTGGTIGTGGVVPEPDCFDAGDCDDFNDCTVDECSVGVCTHKAIVQPHDKCTTGAALVESIGCTSTPDQKIIDEICTQYESCCTSAWTSACVGYVQSVADSDDCSVGCAHDECAEGAALTIGCSTCVDYVCDEDPSCCSSTWDDTCVSHADAFCGGC